MARIITEDRVYERFRLRKASISREETEITRDDLCGGGFVHIVIHILSPSGLTDMTRSLFHPTRPKAG